MKSLKILAVLIFFVGITYYGVEPYAHHVMHPEVTPPDFGYADLPKMNTKGDAARGRDLVIANCAGCHAIKSAAIPSPVTSEEIAAQYGVEGVAKFGEDKLKGYYQANSFGVVPLDLSNAGSIYDENFLANFIKDPAKATEFPGIAMPNLGLDDATVADIVAYLKTIAHKDISPKETTEQACGRCHNIRYAKIDATTPKEVLKKYLGSTPPDLSQMIKSGGEHYLKGFINRPQKLLPGTKMPRTGLTAESEEKVIAYLEQVGDPKKDERGDVGTKVLAYLVILAFMTYLWKVKAFRDVH